MISPVFEALSELAEFANVGFYKVDVDAQEQISQEVGIRAMPTFALFHKGAKIDEVVGADRNKLQSVIQSAASL